MARTLRRAENKATPTELRQQRQDTYSKIMDYLQKTSRRLEAFTLSAKPGYRTDYQWSFLVSQQPEGSWVGLAPTKGGAPLPASLCCRQ